jgi:hypothetical protein
LARLQDISVIAETQPLLTQQALHRFHTQTLKLSFALFDEIEKGSEALWKLLLGILDKARLTLGDNRTVEFSRSMIFMTSNHGPQEMTALLRPGFGLNSCEQPSVDEKLGAKLARAGFAEHEQSNGSNPGALCNNAPIFLESMLLDRLHPAPLTKPQTCSFRIT